MFEAALQDFQSQGSCIEKAFIDGSMTRPDRREVFSVSGTANGLCGMNRYKEAERAWREAMEMYAQGGFKEPLHKIATVPANLATCLWLQGRYTEAEDILNSIITDRNDKSNCRTAHALFALGNVEWSLGEVLKPQGFHDRSEAKPQSSFQTHLQTISLYEIIYSSHHHKVGHALYKIACHDHRMKQYALAIQHLETTLGIFQKLRFFRNESARTKFKLGCILQDSGDITAGREKIKEAEAMRSAILGEIYIPSDQEKHFDSLVMFWSR